jgi:hypothetical protein
MDSEEFRRARAYAAWILLVAAAVEVVIGAWTLSGLPGGPGAVSQVTHFFGLPTGTPFSLRAEEAIPNLLPFTVTALPVAAVLLATLGRPPAGTAHRVTLTAVTIQTVALALGLVAWLASVGQAYGWEVVSWAIQVAVAAAGLILTSAVLRSRGPSPQTRPGPAPASGNGAPD